MGIEEGWGGGVFLRVVIGSFEVGGILTISGKRSTTVLTFFQMVCNRYKPLFFQSFGGLASMNYFAHGVRYIDRPWFAAGTAVPDWLSVVDRRVRVRSKLARPYANESGSPLAELASGILQHLADDDWFHRAPAFLRVSEELTRAFRAALPDDEGFRPAFLGHIVTEIILDGVLIARDPSRLEDYYALFERIDPLLVEQSVSQIAGKSAEGLAWFVTAFCHERFLADYLEPAKLLHRLNQVMRRVKLDPLPPPIQGVLEFAWDVVERNAAQLLSGFPPEDRAAIESPLSR